MSVRAVPRSRTPTAEHTPAGQKSLAVTPQNADSAEEAGKETAAPIDVNCAAVRTAGHKRLSIDVPCGVENFEMLLAQCYEEMNEEDPETRTDALAAYDEMVDKPLDSRDHEPVNERDNAEKLGIVERRGAVINPFKNQKKGEVKDDPALKGNSLIGRLLVTVNTSTVLFMVFSQSLIANYIEYGSYYVSRSINKMIGPSPEVLNALGGLNTNAIRAGQNVRLYWAMWMHSGWIHIGVNVLSQLQFLYIMEPDWGFIRTLLTYWISGITGMLYSSILDPCSVTVGSSGALYGIMAGLIVYVVEFYNSIPNPLILLIFTIVIVVISLISSLAGGVDLWAHLFGTIGGFLVAVGTAQTVSPLLQCLGLQTKKKDDPKIHRSIHFLRLIFPNHNWSFLQTTIRLLAWISLIVLWVIGFTYLYTNYEFQPTGQVQFSGVRQCCCCFSSDVHIRANWFCAYCDVEFDGSTWGDYCKTM